MGVLKGGLFGFSLVFGWNEFDWPDQSKAYLIKTENSNWVNGQKIFGGRFGQKADWLGWGKNWCRLLEGLWI